MKFLLHEINMQKKALTQVNNQLHNCLAVVNAKAFADIINEINAKTRKKPKKKRPQ